MGAGATGVELAGEILTDLPDKDVTIVQSADRLLPQHPVKLGNAALAWMRAHDAQVGGARW